MANSLLRYADEAGRPNGKMQFGRADLDGMPFYGPEILLREDEFDELTETVFDSDVRVFEVTKEEERKALADVIERCNNGWYVIYKMEEQMVPQPDGSIRVFVYCVWSKPHKELNQSRAAMFGPLQR